MSGSYNWGELEYFIENAEDNIPKNFVRVFPADHKTDSTT